MAKNKSLAQMNDDELAKERIALDEQITVLRAKKKAIQDEVDRRLQNPTANGAHNIADAGGIESQEKVGNND